MLVILFLSEFIRCFNSKKVSSMLVNPSLAQLDLDFPETGFFPPNTHGSKLAISASAT